MNTHLKTQSSGLERPFRFRGKAAALAFVATSLVLASSTGCSRQGFQVTESTIEQLSPGNFYIPPKVDIIFAEDNTGSRYEVNNQIEAQLPQFLRDLESRGWNYHFTTTGLTNPSAFDQALASRHDGNWGSQWIAPYPGAPQYGPGTLEGWLFRRPENYSRWVTSGGISNGGNGAETGLETLRASVYENSQNTSIIRDDALLVIIALSNGNDTSGVTYCQRFGGQTVECEDAPSVNAPHTAESSFQQYKTALMARKNYNPDLIRMFAAVSTQGDKYTPHACLGFNAYRGDRYIRMANELRGQAMDICSQPVSNILGSIAQNLQSIRIAQRTRYLFVPVDAEPSSVRVRKYLASGAAVDIANDSVNGFTYEGYLSNVYAIDYPVAMNLSSGYAIELHGSAKLVGDERADVTYIPRGAHDN
jgi:hypothetical protein